MKIQSKLQVFSFIICFVTYHLLHTPLILCLFSSFNFERDIARIIKEQEIVSKRMKEFEEGFAMSKSPTVSEAKIGFAAIQGMARLQEQQACDLSFLRFDPRSNRMTLESTKSSTHDGSTSSPSLAKFPLEIPITPVASPRLLWRFAQFLNLFFLNFQISSLKKN